VFKRFTEEKGVTIVEYAIMLVLVAVVVIVSQASVQTQLSRLFSGVSSFLEAGTQGLGG
jgi:Flp pilus assembly pilin Flp